MNEISDLQDGEPGNGPGATPVTGPAVTAIVVLAVALAVGLLFGLNAVWPRCRQSAPAAIVSVTPGSGPIAGGQDVHIGGVNLTAETQVLFGASLAKTVSAGPSLLKVTAPPHAAGSVDVSLNGHECVPALPNGYTYVTAVPARTAPDLVIGSLAPLTGAVTGGTPITITGTGFAAGALVAFDGVPARDVKPAGATLTALTPAHGPGVVDVSVTVGDRTVVLNKEFTFSSGLTLSSIEPASGDLRGCEIVTIAGTGFGPGLSVTFGGVPALAVRVNSPSSMTAVTPAHHAGRVDVAVALAEASSARLPAAYSYSCTVGDGQPLYLMVIIAGALGGLLHAVRSLSAYAGTRKLVWSWVPMYVLLPVVGAILAIVFYLIIGAGLLPALGTQPGLATVGFGALVGLFSLQAVEKLKQITESLLTKAPRSTDSLAPAAVAVTSVSPASGPREGGTTVTFAGSGFVHGVTVTFDGIPATAVHVRSERELTAVTPAHPAGAVDVTVTRSGEPPAVRKGAYTYE